MPARARPRVSSWARAVAARPLVNAARQQCFEGIDSSLIRIPGSLLLQAQLSRDPNPQIAKLAAHFMDRNRPLLKQLDAEAQQQYDGSSVNIMVKTGTRVGAVPLISPTTGRPDYGIIIKPRFGWSGVGTMLGEMGWKIVPTPLALPMLPRSDRKIPPWVLSTIVLFRIRALLQQLERRFETVEEIRRAPRGSVDWPKYARRSVSVARFLDVPCRFPDLLDDRQLRAAVRFVLQKQLHALETQRTAGVFVLRLIELCQQLLSVVSDVSPREPAAMELTAWLRGPLQTPTYRDGLQAIEWTVDERGLAGLSDLHGLPWVMPMESFFEAWVETVMSGVSRRLGGVLRTGRQLQTVSPLDWQPPFLGSQRYLLPDIVLDRGDLTVIVDAKYKAHWEEMQEHRWGELEDELRERHRADLLQVLAYANVSDAPRTVVCLAYPCTDATWHSLGDRSRRVHRASMKSGSRRIELLLTAMPMGVPAADVTQVIASEISQE